MDQTTIQIKRFPLALWQHVKARAVYRNQTVRQFVIEALEKSLKEEH